MTEPEKPTAEQPTVAPTVSTAPERPLWHFSRIPHHLGRARTSTLVLSVLFLAIGALYLNIRPEIPAPATGTTSGAGTVQQAPASTTAPAPETTAETTTPEPEPTRTPEATTDEPGTPSEEPTETTSSPEGTPEGTAVTTVPTVPAPSTPTPTAETPAG
jgi:cytoskeletal protein RodZ